MVLVGDKVGPLLAVELDQQHIMALEICSDQQARLTDFKTVPIAVERESTRDRPNCNRMLCH